MESLFSPRPLFLNARNMNIAEDQESLDVLLSGHDDISIITIHESCADIITEYLIIERLTCEC